jgi:hypothetical protein
MLWTHARRMLIALACSAVLTAAATTALYVTAAPKWISLLLEPLSLLLLPGLAIAMVVAGRQDFSPQAVIEASALFYLLCAYAWLLWRVARTRSPAHRRTATSR